MMGKLARVQWNFLLLFIASLLLSPRPGASNNDIRNEVERLRMELSNDSLVRCNNVRRINGTLERLIIGLLRLYHDRSMADVNAYKNLLHRKLSSVTEFYLDDGIVLSLLRNFIGVNRLLTEIGYIFPRFAHREQFLIRKVIRSRFDEGSPLLKDSLISFNFSVNTSNIIFKEWKSVQGHYYDVRKIALSSADAAWMEANGQPTIALQKSCPARGQPPQWNVLSVLRAKALGDEATVPLLYVALPLNTIDLNQCDESPHEMLRSTHGCINWTSCLFIPGGGFDLGRYECCCHTRNVSSASVWPWQKLTNRHSQLVMPQTQEQCIDGKKVEEAVASGKPFPLHCIDHFQSNMDLRRALLAINVLCALGAVALIFVVTTQRKVKDWGARGWALMEFFLIGAILLYCIVILEYFQPSTSSCCLIPWCRELGFALFYGAVVLKIHRNLFEHGVRKANYVFIKEKDLLKYLLCIVAFTLVGLLAWTVTAMQAAATPSPPSPNFVSAVVSKGRSKTGDIYLVCTFFHWNLIWHTLEFGFLSYGAYLSWKVRTTNWNERYQFSAAVILEMVVSLAMIITKKSVWLNSSPDLLLLLSFLHAHFTVTAVVVTIMATKLYKARLAPTARDHSTTNSGANRMHPSLAKLRDNLMNGTIDFAEVPIGELNPEDIRAELKRVYTQLRMYKLTNLYMDNPHISKRKGGKKTSNKQTNRRVSIPTVPSKTPHKELTRPTNTVEIDERSSLTKGAIDDDPASVGSLTDFTVHTSAHNVYFAKAVTTTAKTNKLKLDSDLSVCI